MKNMTTLQGLENMLSFPLMEALLGRRSRRFFMGAEIPDGVFAYKSGHKSLPLTDLEKMLVVSACGGNTSWHNQIYRKGVKSAVDLWRSSFKAITVKGKLDPFIVGIFLATGLFLNSAWARDISPLQNRIEAYNEYRFCKHRLHGEIFARTELSFGLLKPDGSEVTEEEFQHFIDTEVTPRFPDGVTLLTGQGQFKDSTGKIIEERSKLLILLYPFIKESNRAIEEIRGAYKDAFQQESVLRVDEQSCVSF